MRACRLVALHWVLVTVLPVAGVQAGALKSKQAVLRSSLEVLVDDAFDGVQLCVVTVEALASEGSEGLVELEELAEFAESVPHSQRKPEL